jgi:hypothetical protein
MNKPIVFMLCLVSIPSLSQIIEISKPKSAEVIEISHFNTPINDLVFFFGEPVSLSNSEYPGGSRYYYWNEAIAYMHGNDQIFELTLLQSGYRALEIFEVGARMPDEIPYEFYEKYNNGGKLSKPVTSFIRFLIGYDGKNVKESQDFGETTPYFVITVEYFSSSDIIKEIEVILTATPR